MAKLTRDKVWWWYWHPPQNPKRGNRVACGYSRWNMDVRLGTFSDGKVKYVEGAFSAPANETPPEGIASRDVLFLACYPNKLIKHGWGESKVKPARIDYDEAIKMGLRPPEWRDNFLPDRDVTFEDVVRAQMAYQADVVGGSTDYQVSATRIHNAKDYRDFVQAPRNKIDWPLKSNTLLAVPPPPKRF